MEEIALTCMKFDQIRGQKRPERPLKVLSEKVKAVCCELFNSSMTSMGWCTILLNRIHRTVCLHIEVVPWSGLFSWTAAKWTTCLSNVRCVTKIGLGRAINFSITSLITSTCWLQRDFYCWVVAETWRVIWENCFLEHFYDDFASGSVYPVEKDLF